MKHVSPHQNQNSDDPFAFFHQLPYYSDYLDNLKVADEPDRPDLTVRGLSDEQVSLLARDLLRQAKNTQPRHSPGSQSKPSQS